MLAFILRTLYDYYDNCDLPNLIVFENLFENLVLPMLTLEWISSGHAIVSLVLAYVLIVCDLI
jgi:hypothetical protein